MDTDEQDNDEGLDEYDRALATEMVNSRPIYPRIFVPEPLVLDAKEVVTEEVED